MADKNSSFLPSTKKKILVWLAALFGFLLLTWCTMLYNDYNRVMRQYVKPAFCINFDQAYQEYRSIKFWDLNYPERLVRKVNERYIINYGFFKGLGYSVELSGAFMPFFDTSKENPLTDPPPPRDPKTGDLLTPWPGILQARFCLFGKEIGRVDRPYPTEAARTADWQLREIF